MSNLAKANIAFKTYEIETILSDNTEVTDIAVKIAIICPVCPRTYNEKLGTFSKLMSPGTRRKCLKVLVHGQTRQIMTFWRAPANAHLMGYMMAKQLICFSKEIGENRCQLNNYFSPELLLIFPECLRN